MLDFLCQHFLTYSSVITTQPFCMPCLLIALPAVCSTTSALFEQISICGRGVGPFGEFQGMTGLLLNMAIRRCQDLSSASSMLLGRTDKLNVGQAAGTCGLRQPGCNSEG